MTKEDAERQRSNMRISLTEVNDVRLARELKNKQEVSKAMVSTSGRLIGVEVEFTYFATYGFDTYTGTVCGVTQHEGSTYFMIREWYRIMPPIIVKDIYVKEVK